MNFCQKAINNKVEDLRGIGRHNQKCAEAFNVHTSLFVIIFNFEIWQLYETNQKQNKTRNDRLTCIRKCFHKVKKICYILLFFLCFHSKVYNIVSCFKAIYIFNSFQEFILCDWIFMLKSFYNVGKEYLICIIIVHAAACFNA